VANFKNTIIIMTSNMASETILENFEDLEAVGDEHRADIIETTKTEVFEQLKANLRPEFLNRIDDKIMFMPLTRDEIKQIALLLLSKTMKNLEKRDMKIEISEPALSLLADLGYDPEFGARPLKRVIQKEIINALSKQILSGAFVAGDTIYISTDRKGFTFSEEGFREEGFVPGQEDVRKIAEQQPGDTQKKSRREADVEKLMKATKEVEDAVKEVKDDDEGGASDKASPKTEGDK
jgi:ATP-dependent Clp protease ATP-binding subunit ClpB